VTKVKIENLDTRVVRESMKRMNLRACGWKKNLLRNPLRLLKEIVHPICGNDAVWFGYLKINCYVVSFFVPSLFYRETLSCYSKVPDRLNCFEWFLLGCLFRRKPIPLYSLKSKIVTDCFFKVFLVYAKRR
jgi:hypothetical protein